MRCPGKSDEFMNMPECQLDCACLLKSVDGYYVCSFAVDAAKDTNYVVVNRMKVDK